MAETEKKPVDVVMDKQNVPKSTLSAAEKKAVLARRLKAVQESTNNTPKVQRALNRLAANINN